jgi:hypothetical protein
MKVRRHHDEDERLVGDLLGRLDRYRVEGVMCAHCRAWGAHDDVAAAGWYQFGGELYCARCAAEEFSVRPPGEPRLP